MHTFGSIQAGEVRWKGMVIGASAGTPVKAIAAGRVILAGYLNGYGYMVIVKHGETDLSLYGFNQAVSVKVGQLVSAGQVIAQVGNTGEISRSALYFGISRKRNASKILQGGFVDEYSDKSAVKFHCFLPHFMPLSFAQSKLYIVIDDGRLSSQRRCGNFAMPP